MHGHSSRHNLYVTFCLGASCLREDLHPPHKRPITRASMTQVILHQPHRTPKFLPLISVIHIKALRPLIYCVRKLEETSIEPPHMRSSPKHNNNKIGPHDLTDVCSRYVAGTVIQLRENIRNYSNRGLSAVPIKFFVANDLHKRL